MIGKAVDVGGGGKSNRIRPICRVQLRSFQMAPKGSYREEHVIKFLSRWLPEWTDERAVANDWRLLYLDAYSAHMTVEVQDLAFERGFIAMYHGGGTTGVAQVNDTDLHAAFEREYLSAEQESFLEQNLVDPGDISRTRQAVIDDVVGVWRGLDHMEGVYGHKRTGLSVSLDGDEDWKLNRDARTFWDELRFGVERDAEVARVRHLVSTGALSWCRKDIDSLKEAFPDNNAGTSVEGQEIECGLDPEEQVWTDSDGEEGEERMDSDDDDDGRGDTRVSSALVPVSLPIVESDTLVEIEEAALAAGRLQTLEKINEAAKASQLPAVQFHVQRQIRTLTKLSSSRVDGREASALMRRFVRKRREDEEVRFRALRDENRRRARHRAILKETGRKLRLGREKARALVRRKEEDLAKLPSIFTQEMLGQGHATGGTRAHCARREACLDRLRLRAPDLPRELRVVWDDFRKEYAKWMGNVHKGAVGVHFLEAIRGVMDDLGDHLLSPAGAAVASAEPPDGELRGSRSAFKAFVLRSRKKMPRAASSLLV